MTKEGLVNSIYEYIKENYPETNYTKTRNKAYI